MRTSHHSFVSSLTAAEPQKIVYIPWTLLCSIVESQFANHCCVSLIYNAHTIFPTNIFLILESTSVKNTIQAVWIKPVNHKPTRHLLPLWNFLFFPPLMSHFGSELILSGVIWPCCPRAQYNIQTNLQTLRKMVGESWSSLSYVTFLPLLSRQPSVVIATGCQQVTTRGKRGDTSVDREGSLEGYSWQGRMYVIWRVFWLTASWFYTDCVCMCVRECVCVCKSLIEWFGCFRVD